MSAIEIGKMLKRARLNAGLTQKDVADKLEITYQAISNYERGQNRVDTDTLKLLCDIYGVQVSDLLGGPQNVPFATNITPMPEMRKIPLLGTIACGDPILAQENISELIDIPKNITADFALTCKGDSMINARIFDGDIVYIRQQETVENGEIAAVLIEDEATLKRIRLFPDHIVLEPENPMYKPLVFWNEEMNTIHILGKAVAFTSAIR